MDEDYVILAEDLVDFCNAIEAAAVDLKRKIGEVMGPSVGLTWNPEKIVWTKAEGAKGPYERSEDVNNVEFKRMLKDLAGHGGQLTREGYFYWIFPNGTTVGRKRVARLKK